MAAPITIWIYLGSLLSLAAISILINYTIGWDGIREVFSWIREFWGNFLTTAPKPLLIVIFLFILLTFGHLIMGTWLNFSYLCDSEDNIRAYKWGVIGGVVGSLQSVFIGYEENVSECVGPRFIGCHEFQNAPDECAVMSPFCNWEAPPDSHCHYNYSSYNWGSKCQYLPDIINETQCGLLGCEWVSTVTSWDNFVGNKTVPAKDYDRDTAEGIIYPECSGGDPIMTLRGVDILNFKFWVILLLIFGFGSLALKNR